MAPLGAQAVVRAENGARRELDQQPGVLLPLSAPDVLPAMNAPVREPSRPAAPARSGRIVGLGAGRARMSPGRKLLLFAAAVLLLAAARTAR